MCAQVYIIIIQRKKENEERERERVGGREGERKMNQNMFGLCCIDNIM